MECYRSFSEFLTRVPSLKLHDWETSITSTIAYFNLKDDLHLVPKKFEIYVDEHLSSAIRFFCGAFQISMRFIHNIMDH